MRVEAGRVSESQRNTHVCPVPVQRRTPGVATRGLQLLTLLCVAVLAGCGGQPVTSHLGALVAGSGTFTSGLDATLILPGGFSGSPTAGTTHVVMTPQAAGTATTLTVTNVAPGTGGNYVLTVTLPALGITAPATYLFTANGTTTTGSFDTSPATAIVVQPGPQISSVSPATGRAGQTLDVTINGLSTNFVNGTTQASFGAGVSVNGSTAGTAGIVAVTNGTTAVAHLVIAATATAGVRDVVVSTGSQTQTLTGGFTVTPAPAAPVASVGGPYTGTTGVAVSFTAAGSTDPGGLALTYAWTFGDGGTATGVAPTHTYAAAGHYPVAVVVTNSQGASSSAATTATVNDPPKAPVANAGGPYTGATGTAITFSGAGSTDPGSLALTYAWTFGDGGTGTGVAPTHTYATAGTYTVTVTATNSATLSNSATTTAVVTDAAKPPVANAGGPYTGTVGTAVTFSAAASTDPKGETLTYAWTFGDGGTGTGVAPTHTYTAAGPFTVSVKVTNTDNLNSTATATATIAAAAQPPVANAGGPYTGTAGTAVAFSGAASTDPKSETLTYAWTFGDGGTGTGVAPTHTYAAAGPFAVSLIVTNTDGLHSTAATASVTIAAAAQPPVANAGGPYTGIAGTAITFSGAASSDPKSEALTYAWTFGDGGTGTGVAPTHTYATAGPFTVSLIVTNTDGLHSAAATTTATMTAAPQLPIANTGGPYTGTAGTAVSFSGAASSDPKSETLTYAWTFGDGGTGTGVAPTHTYATAGPFTVSLTVTNTDGLHSLVASTTATIASAPQPPVANAGGPYTGVAGTAVAFSGAASSDPKSETLAYAWTFGDGGTGTGVAPTHTYATAGPFTVSLIVTNTDGLHSTAATATATIAAAPLPPVANAGGPYTGTAGTAVAFSGAGSSDPKSETLTYAWTFGDGATGTGVAPTHTYATSGTFNVTLIVTNTDSLSSTQSATTATIAAAPQPPVANVGGPYAGTAAAPVSFNGAGSTDPKTETLTYAWTFGDGGTGTGATPTHTYTTAGTYNVTLIVTNTDNLHSTAAATTAVIAAAPQPPTANAGGPYTGTASVAVSFTGTGSTDPKGETLTYAWTFGDGGTSAVVNPTHIYTTAGTYNVTLIVTNTDNLHSTAATTTAAIAPTPGQPPVAVAGGPYTGVAGTPLNFSGSGSSDPKSEALSYAWNFGDNGTGSGATPTHTYAAAGNFTVTLTVTNTDNLSATSTAAVTIAAAPQSPSASAGGPYTGTAGTAITFSGAGSSDPKSETLTYAWTFGDGGTANTENPTHTYTAAGTFAVSLTVTNTDHLSSTAATNAVIAAAPQPPVANVGGPYTGTAGTAVSFNGAGSTDPKSETLSYAWTFGDGGTGTGATPTHTYASAGTFNVSLTVTNTDSLHSAAAATTAVIAAAAQPPVASAGGPYTGTAGTAITFSAAASSDPKGETLSYSWNFGDGSPAGTGVSPTHTYASAGTYNASVTVTNTDALTANATATATIAAAPQAPVASVGGPYTGTTGTAVSFNGAGSTDPKSETLTYSWNFGDGSPAGTGVNPTHTYTTAGTFNVSLTVTNTDNLHGTASTTAVITAPAAQPPVANAGGPYTGTSGVAVSFTGAASSDPKSETLTYSWNFGDGVVGSGVTTTHTYAAAGTYTVTLTVTNADNLTATANATATITAPAAQPPVAVVGGPYTGTAGTAVTFSGAGSSDPKSEALTYAWTFGDGGTGTGVAPTHTYAAAGTFTVGLTVTNADSLSAAASTTATIASPTAQNPVANAGGPYTVALGTAIAFSGLGSSDPKSEALTYHWDFGDGSMGTGPKPSHTYTDAGVYTVTLTVTNTDNASGSATTTATVTAPAAKPPIAFVGGPYAGTAGLVINFSAIGSSDPQNPTSTLALSAVWNFGDGGTGVGLTPVHTYANAGTYNVSVTVTNAAALSATAATTATIIADPNPTPPAAGNPVANANGPYNATLSVPVQFSSAGSSDPNGLALTFSWDFGDGSSTISANPTHTYTDAGTYTIVLTVNNSNNQAVSVSTTVKVVDPNPPAAIKASAGGPYTVAVNQPVQVDASATTNPTTHQLTYTWDFGDGTHGDGVQTAHTYTTQGTFSASITATDGVSAQATATTTVTVGGPAAEAVTASAGGPYNDVTNHAVTLDANGSQDNLGNPMTFTWTFGDGSTGSGASASHAYTAAGKYTATVTATSGTVTSTASAQVTISNALNVVITSPTPNALFGASGVTVSGTLSTSNLTVMVNGVAATVSGTTFTASNVSLREGVNLITATATDSSNGVGSAAVSVILDVTAPGISITSPADAASVSTPSVTVAGLVNDVVTGTIGSNDVHVTVNGIAAQVANRSYELNGVQLVPGANVLTAVVTDNVGNTSKTAVTVNYVPPVNELSLNILSGAGQSGVVKSVLPQPLIVQLLAANGTPVVNRPVTFTVTRSDGQVEVMPTIAQTLMVNTDNTGKASVLFQLGSRTGLGVNQVSATTPGAVSPALFVENTTSGTPTQIHTVRGENQRGLLGQQLAESLQTIVQDGNGNPLAGVPVTYAVTTGDGTLDNTNVTTDTNGRAYASLTLGQQEGINNYTVTANFAGNTGVPVTFVASAFAPGAVANTSVSGVVLDNANTAIVNATVRLMGTTLTTTTDTNGRFKITGAPVGTVTLSVDGSTSTRTQTFPFLSFVLQSLPGQDNTLNKPVYLPAIDVNDAQTVGGDDPVTLTIAGIPGTAFTVAPHSVTFPDGSTVGKLSVSQVKADMVPMEPTNGTSPNLIWTLQPAGTRFSVPVKVSFPNTQGLPPGMVTEFFQYDHDLEQFVSAGTAHVSADGSTIMSDPGFGITKAGWGHILTITAPTACVESCVSADPCIRAQLFNACQCATFANVGAACGSHRYLEIGTADNGSPITIDYSCKGPGKCDANGKCNGTNAPAGNVCDPPLFCDIGGTCNGRGDCIARGTIEPKYQIDPNGSGWKATAQSNITKDFLFIQRLANEGGIRFIHIQANVTGSTDQTKVCCEAKKQKDVAIDNDNLTPQIQITTDQFPIYVNGIPLGKPLPENNFLGFYWQLGGSLSASYTHTYDHCTEKSCSTLVLTPAVTITVGLSIPLGVVNLTASGQMGFQINVGGGCGTATISAGLTPLVITGQVKLFSNYSASATYTTQIPLQVGGTFPVQ